MVIHVSAVLRRTAVCDCCCCHVNTNHCSHDYTHIHCRWSWFRHLWCDLCVQTSCSVCSFYLKQWYKKIGWLTSWQPSRLTTNTSVYGLQEAMKKKLEIQKQKQELLNKQIKEQKVNIKTQNDQPFLVGCLNKFFPVWSFFFLEGCFFLCENAKNNGTVLCHSVAWNNWEFLSTHPKVEPQYYKCMACMAGWTTDF